MTIDVTRDIDNLFMEVLMTSEVSKPGRIDVTKALEMRLKRGMTYTEIADYFGVAKQSAHRALKRFSKLIMERGELEAFRTSKADVLEGVEAQLLIDLADPVRREKASLNNVAYALGQVSTLTRLEKGQSTSNVAYMDMSASLDEIRAQRMQLQEALDAT